MIHHYSQTRHFLFNKSELATELFFSCLSLKAAMRAFCAGGMTLIFVLKKLRDCKMINSEISRKRVESRAELAAAIPAEVMNAVVRVG